MNRITVYPLDRRMVLPLFLMTTLIGCDEDKRLVELANESTQRQAEQNQEMSRLNREVAESHQRLLEADAQSRQELVELQHDLQAEQSEVGRQRDELEIDRQELAEAREREPIIASAISTAGMLMACLMPLVLAWYLLAGRHDGDPDEALGELLTLDLVAEEPLLLPPPGGSARPIHQLQDMPDDNDQGDVEHSP